MRLSANRGHQNALIAGLEFVYNKCDCAISIDCDLQQDEEKIDEFVQKFVSGADIVFGIRTSRDSDVLLKKYTALGFYKFMNLMGVDIIKNHADYRLLSNRAIGILKQYNESNLFLRALIVQMGFKQEKVYFDVKERELGHSKYPLRKMLSFAWNGITSFSIVPLRMVSVLGMALFLLSVFYGMYVFYIKVFTDKAIDGWASMVIFMCFFSGIQLLSLGVIGEYIGKIYIESKKRPRYSLQEYIEG
ncbi:MAG: glycosyltransferase [Helicobacter sp.]|uniref:glycosyltransferase n=1 Tax=Helicobacter sp. 10-6591 TaxID=2004998 RepID=UPI00215CF324|nr:glycosyltransferase [Helicobacter sp. 10-6591]MDD7568165.1 glycosyltransferase [Helicobacter sp.]MDY5740417.1 glycosyltransferase [Helicobacter sp.]